MVDPRLEIAALVVVACVLVFLAVKLLPGRRRGGDTFVSERARAVHKESKEYFDRAQDRATYSEFKAATSGADPVLYTDVRSLWQQGALTPEAVQKTL
ncbi:MAG: hypothetical protein WC700_10115 [Gemmatimonadaceae bacterium]|jgi:hypothetical protein